MLRRVRGMSLRLITRVVLVTACCLSPLLASTADACSCYANPPCAAAWKADAVFIARVAYSAMEPAGGKLRWSVHRLNVDQVFLGEVDSSLTFTPHEKPTQQQIDNAAAHAGDVGYAGSSCDFNFKEGETYLVFARRTADGRWTTSICDGTRPLSEAADQVAYLESIPQLHPDGRIYGTVERTVADRERPHEAVAEPVPNLTVAAMVGTQRFTAITNAEGKFEIRVPPGEYTVRPIVPDTMRVYRDRETHVVAARGCALTNFGIIPDGRIEGRVVDREGAPVPFVTVSAVPPDVAPTFDGSYAIAPSASTDADGFFGIKAVLPGTYYLAVNARWGPTLNSPYPTTFWPAMLSRSDAQTLEIAEGERRSGLRLTVTRLVETTLSGVVLYEDDGRPAVGASVSSSLAGRTLPIEHVSTDASGRFELRAWLGHEYRIQARVPRTDSGPAGSVVETHVAVGDKRVDGVRLVVPR